MNRNILIMGVIFLLLVSACAPEAAPTANPVDVQNTAAAAAQTMVAETQAALPTATTIPPTNPPSPTAPPTNTPLPLPTSGTPGLVPSTTGLPTQPAAQAQPTSSSSDNNQGVCNQALTSWEGPTANFTMANLSKPQGTIVLSMYVETEFGQCGYLVITGDSFSGPVGQYSAGAFITGKQNFKAFGSFRITVGNWKVVVKNDSIDALGGCFPDC